VLGPPPPPPTPQPPIPNPQKLFYIYFNKLNFILLKNNYY